MLSDESGSSSNARGEATILPQHPSGRKNQTRQPHKQTGEKGGRQSKPKKWAKLDTNTISPWIVPKNDATPLVFGDTNTATTTSQLGLNPDAPVFVPRRSAPSPVPQSVQQYTGGEGVVRRRSKQKHSDGRFEEPANHLLNFTAYSKREEPTSYRRYQRPVKTFTKERFLQANYRFVVNAAQAYLKNLYEPDLIVEWENIEQICMFSHERYECPICLDPPRAAKMTKCGHIFCWGCILRYLGTTTRGFRKCPICIESISGSLLKSTVIEYRKEIKEEETASFVLMKRAKLCMVALPEVRWRELDNFLLYSDEDACFSRFVRIADITAVLEKEQAELAETHAIAIASGEIDALPAIELAQHNLDDRRVASCPLYPDVSDKVARPLETETIDNSPAEDVWADEADKEKVDEPPTSPSVVPPPSEALVTSISPPTPAEKEEPEPVEPKSVPASTNGDGKRRGNDKQQNHDDEFGGMYYFYQAADGQHVFLQPLAFRCLLQEYGSIDRLPKTVEAKIDYIEEVTVSDGTRKRWRKIVGHLPLGTAFQFCDVDLNTLVSARTLSAFSGELNFRRAKCLKKKRERGDGHVQKKKAPEPSPSSSPGSWEADLASLPEEVRAALEAAPEKGEQEGSTEPRKNDKEKGNSRNGKTTTTTTTNQKPSPQNQRKQQQPQQQQRTNPQSQRKQPAGNLPSAAEQPASSPPAVPSFLQVLSNTIPLQPKVVPVEATGKGKGGKGKKGQNVSLFSNAPSRKYN